MTDRPEKPSPKTATPPASAQAIREARLAAALRTNLRRRKAAATPRAKTDDT